MKLVRFGESGAEKPGILLGEGKVLDVSHLVKDYDSDFFAQDGLDFLKREEKDGFRGAEYAEEGVRLGPPVSTPSKIICVGLNYARHADEFSPGYRPAEPAIFLKAPSAITGPYDPVIRPPHRYRLDYEVELALVIKKKALDIEVVQAADCIAGYTLMCDVSERDMQLNHGGQWTKGKSYDTFAPLGPCLVTPDEMGTLAELRLWLTVNSEIRQEDYVSSMLFPVPELVSYASQFMSLMPGDILSTGTPAGVGMGRSMDDFLQPGDLIEMGCDPIGQTANRVIAAH